MAVIVRLLVPLKAILEALRLERLIAPAVPVIFTLPVVTVKPFEAVNNPLEVIVPLLAVAIFPEVVKLPLLVEFPLLSIVKALIPPEVTAKALPLEVLLRLKPVAVP